MADPSDTSEGMTVAEAMDKVMVGYLERYAQDPGSLSEEEHDTILCWLLTMDPTRLN